VLKAYILIETTVGTGGNIAKLLKPVHEVRFADRVTGPYDVIVLVETVDLPALHGFLSDRVHPLPGVQKTVTCVVVS